MEALLIIVLIGVAAGFLFYKAQGGSNKQLSKPSTKSIGSSDPLAEQDNQFWNLKSGDLVKQIGGPDYLVRRSITCTEGGYRWNEHLLDDAQGLRRWLSVEDDEGLDLGLWNPVTSADVESGNAGDKTVVVSGVTYGLKEEGSASYATTGTGGQATYGTVDYFQYEAPVGGMLAMQRYDQGAWEASVGEKVHASDLEVFPSGINPGSDTEANS